MFFLPGLIVHKRGVEAPGKALGEGGAGHLGCPVVIGGVAVASQGVLGEGLHQSVELRPKTSLAEVGACIEQMALSLSPFCSPVLEPNLKEASVQSRQIICNFLMRMKMKN